MTRRADPRGVRRRARAPPGHRSKLPGFRRQADTRSRRARACRCPRLSRGVERFGLELDGAPDQSGHAVTGEVLIETTVLPPFTAVESSNARLRKPGSRGVWIAWLLPLRSGISRRAASRHGRGRFRRCRRDVREAHLDVLAVTADARAPARAHRGLVEVLRDADDRPDVEAVAGDAQRVALILDEDVRTLVRDARSSSCRAAPSSFRPLRGDSSRTRRRRARRPRGRSAWPRDHLAAAAWGCGSRSTSPVSSGRRGGLVLVVHPRDRVRGRRPLLHDVGVTCGALVLLRLVEHRRLQRDRGCRFREVPMRSLVLRRLERARERQRKRGQRQRNARGRRE